MDLPFVQAVADEFAQCHHVAPIDWNQVSS